MKSIDAIKTALGALGLFAMVGISSSAKAETVGTIEQCLYMAPKYDVVWRHGVGDVSEKVESASSIAEFMTKRNQLAASGWRVQQLQSTPHVCNGRLEGVAIDAVFRYEPGAYEQYALGLKKADFVAETNRIWSQGLRIHALDSYYYNGEVYFNAMIRKGSYVEGAFYSLDVPALQAKVNEMLNQGWQVNLLDRYNVGNVAYYNVTFRKMNYQNSGVWGWTRSNFETKYSQMRANGWNLFSLSAGKGTAQTFDAFWTNAGWGESRSTRLTRDEFVNQVRNKAGADVHTFVTVWD